MGGVGGAASDKAVPQFICGFKGTLETKIGIHNFKVHRDILNRKRKKKIREHIKRQAEAVVFAQTIMKMRQLKVSHIRFKVLVIRKDGNN